MSPLPFPRKRESYKKAQVTAWKAAGQAAVELAVFGAVLIFLLGTIVRSAMGNSYTQNQNLKAMRMAMLASWNGSKAQTVARNSASILFVEDRLSPDFNKYGDLDRNPYIANGGGTFSYMLMYPLTVGSGGDNMQANLPVMDVYINGQHFPFTTAAYVANKTIGRPGITAGTPACGSDGPYVGPVLTPAQCMQNQCLRNAREWVGGSGGAGNVEENQFNMIVNPAVPLVSPTVCPTSITTTASAADVNIECDAWAIFTELENEGLIINVSGTAPTLTGNPLSTFSVLPSGFINWFDTQFCPSNNGTTQSCQGPLNQVQSILQSNKAQYKLFYTMAVNTPAPATTSTSSSSPTTDAYYPTIPPTCSAHPCKDKELSVDATLAGHSNSTGDLMFDLQRLGIYGSANPSFITTASGLRPYMAWQWAATAATTPGLIGLDATNNQYPAYDVDGRLKAVTIYSLTQNSDGTPTVSYEDYQGGDIDSTWDVNTCTPKPGLQADAQIFTFTQNGTYMQIKEGKLYDPETGQFVRSAAQKDTVDLIQRTIQLSNNTGRFCSGAIPLATVANDTVTPNPVEVCIAPGSGDNCFSSETNIKSTCFDEGDNMLFVRSRLENRNGNFWLTNASGQLQVQ